MASVAIGAVVTSRLPDRRVRGGRTSRQASVTLQICATLLWLPQAAIISYTIGSIASDAATTSILWPVLGVTILGILRAVSDSVGLRIAFRAARNAATDLRSEAVAALAARSPLDPDRPLSGRAASVIGEQAELVVPYLARFETARLRAVVVPIVILLVVLPFSWVAALVLFVSAPLIPVFMALIGWKAKAASEAQLAETGSMNAFLLDRLRGMATIRALGAVDVTASRLRDNAESVRTRTMAVLKIAFLSSAVLELFSALGVAMVAVYVGFHLLGQLNFGTWSRPLDLGEGLFILLLAPAFFEPLRDLSSVWHDRAAGNAAVDELRKLAAGGDPLPGADGDETQAPATFSKTPAIVTRNLSFRYPGARAPVLDQLDLAIAGGEHVALLGPSGSGKSTLLALLLGLAEPTSGSISIGGRVLSGETAAGLRNHIGWIGQRPHIFAGTLATNVTLGRRLAPQRVARALQFAKLDEIARTRHLQSIGENGIGLSGGETLRLAIARVAANPDAQLIIADEPTAHLDSETARSLTENLLALARSKTLIVATHDLALAGRMDRIVRIGNSRLVEAA